MKRFTLFILLIILSSCWSYRTLNLENKNPTEYIYPLTQDFVKKELIKSFSKNPYKGLSLIYYPKDTFYINYHDTVRLNKNRLFLYNDSYKLSSQIYYKHNRKLRYYAGFLIIISSVNSIYTKVKIETVEPQIVVGRDLFPKLPHMVRYEKTKAVSPSTIEEYELLLYIGKKLNVDSMPPIHYPKGYYKLKEAKDPW